MVYNGSMKVMTQAGIPCTLYSIVFHGEAHFIHRNLQVIQQNYKKVSSNSL